MGHIATKQKILAPTSAVIAVALWSITPILMTMIGNAINATEVFIIAMLSAVIAGVIIAVINKQTTMKLFENLKNNRSFRRGVIDACISGLFIGLWYFGFYNALSYGPKIEVTVVAFIWPLLSIIAMRIFAKELTPPLKTKAILLIGASFIGVALITLNGGQGTGSNNLWGVMWAFIGAVGSGLYLPFAVRASKAFSEVIHSGPLTTFYSVSVGNLSALIVGGGAMMLFGLGSALNGLTMPVLLICVSIGVAIYLFAEVAWTWAFKETQSLTLSSLPYFSPAVSVVLLAVIYHEQVTVTAMIGLVIILASNLWLHFGKTK